MPHHDDHLIVGESVIMDRSELLLRQVHPLLIHDGQIASSVFLPTERDEGKLSVRRGSRMSPEEAYRDHTATLGLKSIGTAGCTVDEALKVNVRAVDDSILPDRPRAHAYLDFRQLSKKDAKDAAQILKRAASTRGLLYSASA